MLASTHHSYLITPVGLANLLCLLCPQIPIVPLEPRQSAKISHQIQRSNDAGLSKQCIFVKMVVGVNCQNGAGMSKHCRYILSKWRRFANGLQQNAKAFRRNKCLQQAKQAKRVYKTSLNHQICHRGRDYHSYILILPH